MNVTVKLYGGLLERQVYKSNKREINICNNEIEVSIKENSSLLELLEILGISIQTGIMCLINGKITCFDDKLSDGNKVEIILLVDGG